MSSCAIHKTIYVADSFADCEDQPSKKCLKVKEAQEDDWIVLHDGIEGFDYKEGTTYKIEVKAIKIKDPVANGNSLKYSLEKVIYEDKSKISQEVSDFGGSWKVSKLIGLESLNKSPTLKVDFDSKKISGNAGCNSYGTDFSIEADQLKIGIPVATKMMCTNMKIEKAFFSCLQNTSNYKLVDGKLILYSKNGKEQMTCVKTEK